jgi:hypothetical protein
MIHQLYSFTYEKKIPTGAAGELASLSAEGQLRDVDDVGFALPELFKGDPSGPAGRVWPHVNQTNTIGSKPKRQQA